MPSADLWFDGAYRSPTLRRRVLGRREQPLQTEEPSLEELVTQVGHGQRGRRAEGGLQPHRRRVRAEPARQLQVSTVGDEIVRDEVMVYVEAVTVCAQKDHEAAAKEA